MSALPRQKWTPESYLAFERSSDQRHEYLDGKIFLQASASANHNLILGNTYAALHQQLRKQPCYIYPSDMRVKVSPVGLYTYPDISVACDTPQFEDEQHDILLNPILIVEVLSPSTESYDRGKKFQLYRTLDTLQEYVLISHNSHRIEKYLRQAAGEWLLTDIIQLESMCDLASIHCTLALADVYEKVTFDDEPA